MAFNRGKGGSGGVASFPAEAGSLKELRATLGTGQQRVVRAVCDQFERELIESLPELNAGVRTAKASGSFSATLQVSKAKRGRFSGKLSTRVRTPREAYEFDLHVADDGQLQLGLPPGYEAGA